MKEKLLLLLFLLFLLNKANTQTTLSGVVFKDFNANGVRDNTASFSEPFLAGVSVTAFNSFNVQVGPTKITNASGAYSFLASEIPTGTPIRVQFQASSLGFFNSFVGTANGSNVQFVTSGSGVVADYAVLVHQEYSTATAPPIIATKFVAGNPLATSGTATTNSSIQIFDFNSSGTTLNNLKQQVVSQTGSIFGMSYVPTTKKLFTAAFIKRHAGLGPAGVGGIYVTNFDASNNITSTSMLINLAGVPGINFETVPTPASRGITGNSNTKSRDSVAFRMTGKNGLGGMAFDPKTNNLFVVNLFERNYIKINLTNYFTTGVLPNSTNVTEHNWDLSALPNTGGASVRPFAMKIYKNELYTGFTSTAETEPATNTAANMYGTIVKINLQTNVQTNLPSFSFNYTHGTAFNTLGTVNRPWTDNISTSAGTNGSLGYQAGSLFGETISGVAYSLWPITRPSPWLTDIEFDNNGDIIIGITDRGGHQWGGKNRHPDISIAATTLYDYRGAGDILRAKWDGTTFTLENAGTTSTGGGCGTTSVQGPGGGEYYCGDKSTNMSLSNHQEISTGTVTQYKGYRSVLLSVYDPITENSSGLIHINNTTAVNEAYVQVNAEAFGTANTMGGFNKANGMGDVELMTTALPLQIGNRVWHDVNANGIQDAHETTSPLAVGSSITLRSPGVDDTYNTADDQTWTTTVAANGTYYFSSLSSADNRKPTSFIGLGNVILPNYRYRIELSIPSGYELSINDIATNTVDQIDNDAYLLAGIAVVDVNTNAIDHNYDIGLKRLASVSNRVWLDNGLGGGVAQNGIQDGNEQGLSGITVTLYTNGADGTHGNSDDQIVGTVITDATGLYIFNNLTESTSAATSYNLKFTLPPNYIFTTQTNTQVTGTSNATNITNVTGGATAANGSDVNVNTGRTGSFWLEATEDETTADCGIYFANNTNTSNSIEGKVWFDFNSDGAESNGDLYMAGITVSLLDNTGNNIIATTITNKDGIYYFSNLSPSTNYIIAVTPPAGQIFVTSTGTDVNNATNSDVSSAIWTGNYGRTTTFNSGVAGTTVTGIDAGITVAGPNTASIGNKVWNDFNNNGVQGSSEPGIPNVVVLLYQDVNGNNTLDLTELLPFASAKTDAFGVYNFNNLPVTANNKWLLEFTQPVGFNNTTNNTGSDFLDSDINNNTNDRTGFIRLIQAERNNTIDAGFTPSSVAGTLQIGSRVWHDNNKNGIQNSNESGVEGVTVNLYQNGADGRPGTSDDVLLRTATTDVAGNYTFAGLAASTGTSTYYNVEISNLKQGYISTFQTNSQSATGTSNTAIGGATNANGNDGNSLGRTGSINLTASTFDFDFGMVAGKNPGLASIGNLVFIDLDADGIKDTTEVGLQNITVNLYRDANNSGLIDGAETTPIKSTLTDALGSYIFTGLSKGKYQIGFVKPSALNAYGISTINVGTNDDIDSDANAFNTAVEDNTASTNTSFTNIFNVGEGQQVLNVNAGLTIPSNTNTLGNLIWIDANKDGAQQANEPGVRGVTVSLYFDANNNGIFTGTELNPIASTTSNEIGLYLFTGLPNGNYVIKYSNLPQGFSFTNKSSSNTTTESDADLITGFTPMVVLDYATGGTSRNNTTLDAGIVSTKGLIGNRVWDDYNADGIQTTNELGVPGTLVLLTDETSPSNYLGAAITDAQGNYSFFNAATNLSFNVNIDSATLLTATEITVKDNHTGSEVDGTDLWFGLGDSDCTPSGNEKYKTNAYATGSDANPNLKLNIDIGITRRQTATIGNRV